jgi:hypothetical protein
MSEETFEGPSPSDDRWFTEQVELDDLLDLYEAPDDGGELPFYDPLWGYEP